MKVDLSRWNRISVLLMGKIEGHAINTLPSAFIFSPPSSAPLPNVPLWFILQHIIEKL